MAEKLVSSYLDLQPKLHSTGSRLAMVNKYPPAAFLEVRVHQCQGIAATNNISATPIFLFFRNKVRIDQYQRAIKEHGFDNCFQKGMTFLESDCDEQLFITVAFNQPVKLYSMRLQGPANALELTEDNMKEVVVWFNQGKETIILYLTFIGTVVQTTNMNDFKPVVGKKGESHKRHQKTILHSGL
ncbi:unnamed protein product [Nyctereutes procyonoides]|uniref:(raccoon dog) hypothetical protein n=1 Tax=Nyctereutes procyonoides TaxID=34880 RepID=A0A811YH81_NYCPR|nr:unnamed protein product [Nyctereutes procyonoides]